MNRTRSVFATLLTVCLGIAALSPAAQARPTLDEPASAAEASAAAGPTKLRVMTYNIRFGEYGLDGLEQDIRKANPDIVMMQEVDHRTGGVHQARNLANRLNMQFRYHGNAQKSWGTRGNALLIRNNLTVIKVNKKLLTKGDGDGEQRGIIMAKLATNGGRAFWVASTHLHFGTGRAAQATQVSNLLKAKDCTTFLGGDMNSKPGEQPSQTLRTHLTDVWRNLKLEDGYTNKSNDARIDYIYFKEATAESAYVPGQLGSSDHRPVIADLRFGDEKACPPPDVSGHPRLPGPRGFGESRVAGTGRGRPEARHTS
ncbi:endonuclease/exonuclease/phosphatase family protein [Phycicoccus sp. CSK15P-2]|uniref:endonuclease/exonuclease/phosphatase family protein n=1 Tax=Phycicoccus sp. CSK15P-2 TaxID=2807627 RepID=UPI0019511592|nr:endonuclease/exonuclease/phosphatase family protein [Phycicoccus sp. CSK15P-2]MBM6405847.1 endonuclease/exonuclease/phosphatase family protein [Phycicoccus sp. CSK15P-2]